MFELVRASYGQEKLIDLSTFDLITASYNDTIHKFSRW
jgi:hypothetical protein